MTIGAFLGQLKDVAHLFHWEMVESNYGRFLPEKHFFIRGKLKSAECGCCREVRFCPINAVCRAVKNVSHYDGFADRNGLDYLGIEYQDCLAIMSASDDYRFPELRAKILEVVGLKDDN